MGRALPGYGRLQRLVSPTLQRLRGLRRPLIVWSGNGWHRGPGASSYLRGYLVARELERRGWGCLYVPQPCSPERLRRILRGVRPDLLMIHKARQARHAVEHFEGVPFVFDLDDADFLDPKLTGAMIGLCREARAVIAGSRYIADWCRGHNPATRISWTGSPGLAGGQQRPHVARDRSVAWAVSDPVAYPAEAEFVRRALLALPEPEGVIFRLYGVRPDYAEWAEGYIGVLRERGLRCETIAPLEYGAFLSHLGSSAIGLAPFDTRPGSFSLGKSFGKVLGYLAAGCVCVVNDAADHAVFFESGRNGLLIDDPEAAGEAIGSLLADAQRRQALADAASMDYEASLSVGAAADRVEGVIREVLGLSDQD